VKAAKRFVLRAASVVGADAASRYLRRGELLAVNYHGLRTDMNPRRDWLLLSREQFVEQCRFLARHYDVRPVDDAVAAMRAGTLTRPTACITFDDGYRNNLTIALPVLRELGLPATIYLATGLIGTDTRLWTIRIELAFQATRADRVDLDELGLPPVSLGDRARNAAERELAGLRVKEKLKTLPAVRREAVVDRLLERLDVHAPDDGGDFAFLDWDEVTSLGRSGLVTFGGHTVHHEIVSRLDDAAVDREVSDSVVRARATGYVSETFAYPNGGVDDFDARAGKTLGRLGISTAFTTIDGLNSADTPPFAMRRVVVGGDWSLDAFRFHVSGLASGLRGSDAASAGTQ
jgi:peptidoglycan/xylan/chitin deacetylase (PgdA/CDA1 family)